MLSEFMNLLRKFYFMRAPHEVRESKSSAKAGLFLVYEVNEIGDAK